MYISNLWALLTVYPNQFYFIVEDGVAENIYNTTRVSSHDNVSQDAPANLLAVSTGIYLTLADKKEQFKRVKLLKPNTKLDAKLAEIVQIYSLGVLWAEQKWSISLPWRSWPSLLLYSSLILATLELGRSMKITLVLIYVCNSKIQLKSGSASSVSLKSRCDERFLWL